MIGSRSALAQRPVRAHFSNVLAATVALSAVSCGPNVQPPDVKLNPVPKQRYEITLTVENPPAQISAVTGSVQSDVEDKTCMPMTDPIAGVWKHAKNLQPVTFRRAGGNRYVGHFYADNLIDEDYYSLGVCQWRLSGIEVLLHVGTLKRKSYLDADEVFGEKRIRSLCRRDNAEVGICLTPPDAALYDNPQFDFIAILESRRISP